MKKLSFAIILIVTANILTAQVQKGSVLLGGTVGITNYNNEGAGITFFDVFPKVGFFLSNRFALGGGLEFRLVTSDGSSEGSIGQSIFSRIYFNKSGMSRFFAQLDLGAWEPDLDDGEVDIMTTGSLSLGADFFLNQNVAIETVLGYRRLQDFEADAGLNNIFLNIGVAAFIGGNKGR